jgi:hypothetical protein
MAVTHGLMQQQNAAYQMQDSRLAADQKRRAIADDDAYAQAVRESGGDPVKLRAAVIANAPRALGQFDKTQAEIAAKQASADKDKSQTKGYDLENIHKVTVQLAERWGAVKTPEEAVGLYVDAVKSGLLPFDKANAEINGLERVRNDPAAFQAYAQGQRQQGMTVAAQMKQALDVQKQQEDVRQFGVTRADLEKHRRNTEGAAWGNLKVAQDREKRESAAANGGSDGISPQAIINAATRYNMDGTLPPMGMGKTGAAGRVAILNEAARQAGEKGDTPEAQRIRQVANKAASTALNQLTKQQSMVGAFEKNFNKNADIALELSSKFDRTGVPLVNKWINAGKRSITGDPELSALDASVKATVNEYAKIVSGSMGNTATAEGEIKKIEGILNAAQTPAQVKAVLDLMKRETKNRMDGFEEEKRQLTDGMMREPPKPAARTVTRTGTDANGKKVIQYSDGTIEHAN